MPMQFARRAGIEVHVDAGDPLADRELINRRLLRPPAGRYFRTASVEREPEVRHSRNVLWIVISNCRAWRQRVYAPAKATVARISMTLLERSGFGDSFKSNEPTGSKRRST